MTVYTDIEHLPPFKNAVVTIGTFDGVHLGHRKIIEQLVAEGRRVNGETVIITFHPHPRKIVPERNEPVQLLTTIEERAELIRRQGVDNLVIVPFNRTFSEQSPEHYVEDFLITRFRPRVLIIGYDHKFGRQRGGDYKLLERYAAKGSFELKEIPQHVIDHNTVSSTRIRAAMNAGEVFLANRLLGYDFFFEGIVMRGDQRGRTIGFPTANLQLMNEDKMIPANGVYAVSVQRKRTDDPSGQRGEHEWGPSLGGMMNIGVRPTVDGTKKTIEVHLFDFAEELYGVTLRVYVKQFIRSERKFNGIDDLKAQLQRDKVVARSILSTPA